MKTFLLSMFVLLSATTAHARICYRTTPGVVWVNGRRAAMFHFNGATVTVACTLRHPTWLYWRGGNLCIPGTIYGRDDGYPFACRILSIR